MVDYSVELQTPKRYWPRFMTHVRAQFRAHFLLVVSCLVYFTIGAATNISLGKPVGFSAMPYLEIIFTIMVPVTFMVSLIGVFAYMAFIKKPEHLIPAMFAFYKPFVVSPQRWARAIPAIGFMMLGFMAYTDLKETIPLLHPYSWDVRFMQLDHLIHFGHDPWRILQPIFGHTAPTQALNFVYNLWFFIMFSFWLCAGWTQNERGWERRYLLSFLWCWMIGGSLLAIVFSSMGPAFYDLIDASHNPYAAQMVFLNTMNETHNVMALGAQDLLRESYLNPHGSVAGISAMPSLHNATSTIFMLTAYKINKVFGHIMLAFLACILIGSVHLAWHYAVDAYVGILLALSIWVFAGKAIAWQDRVFKVT